MWRMNQDRWTNTCSVIGLLWRGNQPIYGVVPLAADDGKEDKSASDII